MNQRPGAKSTVTFIKIKKNKISLHKHKKLVYNKFRVNKTRGFFN